MSGLDRRQSPRGVAHQFVPAAPSVVAYTREHPCLDRVLMYVAQEGDEVYGTFCIFISWYIYNSAAKIAIFERITKFLL